MSENAPDGAQSLLAEILGQYREPAWRYMQSYHGQTPFYSFLVFLWGRRRASEFAFTESQWGTLNAALWDLKQQQLTFFGDLSRQSSMF